MLYNALPENVTVHLGIRITGVENIPERNKARVTFTSKGVPPAQPPPTEGGAHVVNGTNGPSSSAAPQEQSFEADVIIGADGVRSVTRTMLGVPAAEEAGNGAGKPAVQRYTGTYCYRGLIPMEQALSVDPENSVEIGNTLHRPRMAFGPGRHLTIFPIEQHKVSPQVPANECENLNIAMLDFECGSFRFG